MSAEDSINKFFAEFEHTMDERVPQVIATRAVDYYQDSFRKEEFDGKGWPALSPKYAKKVTRGTMLRRSGALYQSIHPAIVNQGRVVISAGNSRAPYARVHNEGLRIKAVAKIRGYTNKNFMGKGRPQKIKAHSRNINFVMPRRQFMGHAKQLNRLIIADLKAIFNN